jgi:hypothetical protein
LAVIGYRVYQDGQLLSAQTGTSRAVTGLTPGTSYTFHVVGYTSALDSAASANLVASTLATDLVPDPFTIAPKTGVAQSTLTTSDPVTITGINGPVAVTVLVGEWDKNSAGAWTTSAGSVVNNDTVRVRHTSSANVNESVNSTLTVGGVQAVFTSTTAPADAVPNDFSFASLTGMLPGIPATSLPATITGINVPVAISVSGGTYSINGAAYTASPGTISNGQTVRLQHTSGAGSLQSVTTTVTIAGISRTFTSTTQLDTQSPTAPFQLEPVQVTPSSYRITYLAADDDIGVEHYVLYINGVYHDWALDLDIVASGLAPSTTYTFTVRAFDIDGNQSPASNARTVTTPADAAANNRSLSGALQAVAVRSAGAIAVEAVGSPGASITDGILTVTGSGFGTRPDFPLVFDNFASGVVGADVYGQPPTLTRKDDAAWTWDVASSGHDQPKYSNANRRTAGSNNVLLKYGGNSGEASAWTCALKVNQPMPDTGDELYFTYWWRYEDTSFSHTGTQAWSRNTKPFDFWPASEGSAPFVYIGMGNPDAGNGELRFNGIDQYVPWDADTQLDLINGEWIRFEVYLKQSAPNTANGVAEVTVHRTTSPSITLQLNANATSTRTAADSYWQNLWIGAYSSTEEVDGGPSYLAWSEVHMDNVYVDNTRARVEIGNAPTWAACTRREVQPHLTWEDTSITAIAQKGLLSAGANWVYVVSAAGTASAGIPITLA